MMTETDNTLVLSLKDQWRRTWGMWEDLIDSIPEAEWIKGDPDYLVPVRHLIHAVLADDFFFSDLPLEDYDDQQWFEGDEWETPANELPGKESALAMLAAIKNRVEDKFEGLSDADLLIPERVHTWTGQTRLAKLLFSIRHTQHHLGEVNAELIHRGMQGVRWR